MCFCLFDGYIHARQIWAADPADEFGPTKGDGKQNPETDCLMASLGNRVEAGSPLPNLWGKTWRGSEEGCSHDVGSQMMQCFQTRAESSFIQPAWVWVMNRDWKVTM